MDARCWEIAFVRHRALHSYNFRTNKTFGPNFGILDFVSLLNPLLIKEHVIKAKVPQSCCNVRSHLSLTGRNGGRKWVTILKIHEFLFLSLGLPFSSSMMSNPLTSGSIWFISGLGSSWLPWDWPSMPPSYTTSWSSIGFRLGPGRAVIKLNAAKNASYNIRRRACLVCCWKSAGANRRAR